MSDTEKIQLDYDHVTTYTATPLNAVGATTSTTLRTVTAYDDTNCKHVKKWGTDYSVSAISNAVIEHPRSAAGNAWTFDFQGWNGSAWVSMGTVADTGGASGAFAAGASFAATKVKIVVTPDAGDTISITDGDHITLTTSADAGGLSVMLSGESMTTAFTLYLSASGSTYYDTALKYGGKRHTPTGTAKYPYFHPVTAYAALGGAFTIVTILDSAHYQIDEWSVATASTTVQAALGQTPTLCSPIGASVYRDVIHDGNNSDTAYVASTGSDVTGNGKWWTPYATHSAAFAAIGARAYINTQDSETFDEILTIDSNCVFEPIYGIIPTINGYDDGVAIIINVAIAASNAFSVYGYNFTRNILSGNNTAIYIFNDLGYTYTGYIKNCSFSDIYIGINISGASGTQNFIIENNYFTNCSLYAAYLADYQVSTGTIRKNITIGNGFELLAPSANGSTLSASKNIGSIGWVVGSFEVCNFTIENNTSINAVRALEQTGNSGTFSGTVRNNVGYGNTIDLLKTGTSSAPSIINSCYLVNSGFTIGAGNITTDPEPCEETYPYKYGISTLRRALDSTNHPYHTGTSSNSMGVITHGILLGANSITFNGIIFDGLDSYAHAIYELATRTGTTLKWCTFQNYIGIAVDLYATAATSAVISNCLFKANGQALAMPYGSNNVSYCVFNSNNKIGIWLDYTQNYFDHCFFYGSDYNFYLDINGGMTFKNSIVYGSGLYALYSDISVSPTYSCIIDATYNVTLDSTNIIDNPLFVDPENNDFRLKVTELGYIVESPCKQAADDGYDMGAYLYEYSISADSWKKYVLEFNPFTNNETMLFKGATEFEDGNGNYSSWAKSTRMRFPMVWSDNAAMSETQRKTLKYIKQKNLRRENTYTDEGCIVRYHPAKSNYYGSGTGTILVDATNKKGTLTDTSATYFPQDKKGFFCTVIFHEQSAAVVDATAKTITKAAAGWTENAWTGYYFYQNNMYFYIVSNTTTVLTVSDANNYLTTSASFDMDIVKYFKITESTETVLTLADYDLELVAGSYKYYIDFVKCRVVMESWEAKQVLYDFATEATKTGFTLTLEEID